MSAIVHQKDKRSGITYAYESTSFWDKEKKQSRSKRKLIGRVDDVTGEIVPTRKRSAKALPNVPNIPPRQFSGATYLFDEIGVTLGITSDLKKCFPDLYKQILSIAYYLILEDKNPMSRFAFWEQLHRHPFGKSMSSQRISELFASINEAGKNSFFMAQKGRKKEREYWIYDTTSISSYSKCLSQVKYGNNKDGDHLEQLNLAMVFGEESQLPFYYRKLPGNISDVSTVKHLIGEMGIYGGDKVKLVMDRGFYSEANVNAMFKAHYKFLMSVKTSLRFVQTELKDAASQMRSYQHYSPDYDLYAITKTIDWSYTENHRYKGNVSHENRRLYLHMYYNAQKAVDDERTFNKRLITLESELKSGNRRAENENAYAKYFDISETPKRGVKVIVKQDAVNAAKQNYGYFALISNEIKDPFRAIGLYRNKDLIEKAFENLKDRLNFGRMHVSSEKSLDGKLFVEFIALIFLSYIKMQMSKSDLFRKYTISELLDSIDIIERYELPGKQHAYSEVTAKQRTIYAAMGFAPPASLC